MGEAGGYLVTDERKYPDQSSSRERKLVLGLTDDLMVMEPDGHVQVKMRTCVGGCRGPEPSVWHLGVKWWQAEDGSPGRSQAGGGERACEFRSIKVRVPRTSQWRVHCSELFRLSSGQMQTLACNREGTGDW